MEKFNVEILETLSKLIEVEAETKEDAISKVREMYFKSEIVLSADEFVDSDFKILIV